MDIINDIVYVLWTTDVADSTTGSILVEPGRIAKLSEKRLSKTLLQAYRVQQGLKYLQGKASDQFVGSLESDVHNQHGDYETYLFDSLWPVRPCEGTSDSYAFD